MKFPRINFKLPRIKLQPKSATYLTVAAFFVVGGIYVFAVNFVANKGTTMRQLENENRNLQGENERLEVEAARLKSLRVIEDGASKEVKVGDLEETKDENQKIVVVPKMYQVQQQRYLPSYSTLAALGK